MFSGATATHPGAPGKLVHGFYGSGPLLLRLWISSFLHRTEAGIPKKPATGSKKTVSFPQPCLQQPPFFGEHEKTPLWEHNLFFQYPGVPEKGKTDPVFSLTLMLLIGDKTFHPNWTSFQDSCPPPHLLNRKNNNAGNNFSADERHSEKVPSSNLC